MAGNVFSVVRVWMMGNVLCQSENELLVFLHNASPGAGQRPR